MEPSPDLCMACKGRNYCNLGHCPLLNDLRFYSRPKEFKKEFFGSSPPGIFVGRHNYPNMNVGLLSPIEGNENAWIYDAPDFWSSQNIPKQKIIDYRTSLVNSRTTNKKVIEKFQDIAMSIKPIDVEVYLKKKPRGKMFTRDMAPVGPSSDLDYLRVADNPKIPIKVDKVVHDDIKAEEGLYELYKNNFSVYYLEKLFSAGLLGIRKKLVPTRWGITATDDSLAKTLLGKVRDFSLVEDYYVFEGGHYGNSFRIFLLPDNWSFELFELWNPNTFWWRGDHVKVNTDYELFYGRKKYAQNTAGGYYASRLPIVEYLMKKKKQASVIAIREIDKDYNIPLGVWVVREAARKAMQNPRKISLEEVRTMLGPLKSKIMDFHVKQKRLMSFVS